MANNNNQDLYIKDIDLALYKYGIIDKTLNNSFNIEVTTNRFQKYKTYLNIIWLFINIIRYIIYLINYKNGKLPKYYFDCTQYFG